MAEQMSAPSLPTVLPISMMNYSWVQEKNPKPKVTFTVEKGKAGQFTIHAEDDINTSGNEVFVCLFTNNGQVIAKHKSESFPAKLHKIEGRPVQSGSRYKVKFQTKDAKAFLTSVYPLN